MVNLVSEWVRFMEHACLPPPAVVLLALPASMESPKPTFPIELASPSRGNEHEVQVQVIAPLLAPRLDFMPQRPFTTSIILPQASWSPLVVWLLAMMESAIRGSSTLRSQLDDEAVVLVQIQRDCIFNSNQLTGFHPRRRQ